MNITHLPNSNVPVYTTPDGIVYLAGGNNANCTVSVCPIELSVYGYRPSLPASSILIVLYSICMVIQLVQAWRYKTWGFLAAMLLGCVDEILGYVGRILYWNNPWGQTGFIMQIVLITIGPVFFSAAIYVLLAQIVRYISLKHSRFTPKWFYYIFISCDIISLTLQAVGGAMSSTSNGRSQAGVNIALGGLGFQVFTLLTFMIMAVDYAWLSRSVWMAIRLPRRFIIFITFLTAAAILIQIRCCYRVYELSKGYSRDSEALRDQSLFIALESVMVIIAAYCLIIAHPGFVFKRGEEQLVADQWAAAEEKGVSSASSN